jgi:D-alanyl-D-alanine carboxypeptidase
MGRIEPVRLGVLGFLTLCLLSLSVDTQSSIDEQGQAATQFLNSLIESKQTPGVQYLFVDADKTLFEFHGGMADLGRQTPVTRSTTFNGYSITKTFTAAAVIELVQQGKIDLDAPIRKYLKEFPYPHSPTIRQTLLHTGGFPNPNPISWIHLAKDHASFDEQVFLHQVITDNPELDAMPGEKYAYSNVGYLLLGEVIHQVSGKSYSNYVLDEIIKPLSLGPDDHIAFTIDSPANHAPGHIRRWYWLNPLLGWFIEREQYLGQAVDGWVPFNHILINGNAYGGLIGNAEGFARYLQAILATRPPFNKEMLTLMWQAGSTRDGQPIGRNLSWFQGSFQGLTYYSHAGGAAGYYCELRLYPDIRRASVIMTNNTGISDKRYLDQIDRFFIRDKG